MLVFSLWSISRGYLNSITYLMIFLTVCTFLETSSVVTNQVDIIPSVTTEPDRYRSECTNMIQRFEALYQPNRNATPTKKLEILHRAASIVGEDPVGCLQDSFDRLFQEQREKLVVLSVKGKHQVPAAIYSCELITHDLRCQGIVADDTMHLEEFESPIVSLGITDSVQILTLPGYQPIQMQVYELNVAATQTSKSLIPVLSKNAGVLKLHMQLGKKMIICIVKERNPQLYIKYVWLVHIESKK